MVAGCFCGSKFHAQEAVLEKGWYAWIVLGEEIFSAVVNSYSLAAAAVVLPLIISLLRFALRRDDLPTPASNTRSYSLLTFTSVVLICFASGVPSSTWDHSASHSASSQRGVELSLIHGTWLTTIGFTAWAAVAVVME